MGIFSEVDDELIWGYEAQIKQLKNEVVELKEKNVRLSSEFEVALEENKRLLDMLETIQEARG